MSYNGVPKNIRDWVRLLNELLKGTSLHATRRKSRVAIGVRLRD